MSEVALSIENVDKVYQRRGKPQVHAVKVLQMEVNKGEIVALLGSSGCGKTSTLRMIAGFEEVTNGGIKLTGRRIDKLPPAQRGVTMAFEGYSLYPPLSIGDNIAFALKSARLPQKDVRRAVEKIARLLEIETILDRYPSSISGGQQQRASLARALVRNADLYLLDEPMGQLEPQLRALLRGRLKSLLVERSMTSIFVTHDQTEANALADRIAVMEGGVLQQFANPKELRERPVNLFVATFVGEPPMNVFEAASSTPIPFASLSKTARPSPMRNRTCRTASEPRSASGTRRLSAFGRTPCDSAPARTRLEWFRTNGWAIKAIWRPTWRGG